MPPSRPQRRHRRAGAGAAAMRLRLGFIVIAMVLSLFGARLVQLQGIDPKSYAAMAAAEGIVRVTLPAERGDILDRNGEPLADSVDGMMVVADPHDHRRGTRARQVPRHAPRRRLLPHPPARCARKGSRFEYVARGCPPPSPPTW